MFLEIVFGWLIGSVLGIVAHEAGHAFAAMATGMRVKKIAIGWGEPFFARTWRGIRIELNRNPGGGCTQIEEEIYLRKGAYLFMLLAGSLCNIVLLLGAAAAWYYNMLPARADYLVLGFSCAQIFLIAFALQPDAASVGHGGWSDGRRIAFLLKQKNGSLTPLAQCHLLSLEPYANGKDPVASLSPASLRLMDIHHDLHHGNGELPAEIVQAAVTELSKGEMSTEEELMILDSLISKAVVNGNKNLHAGMEEWSNRAMERGSHINTIKFSRAAVLIELGRFMDGKALIEASEHPDDRPYDAVLNSIFLAKAEAGLGNHDRADDLLAQASIRISDESSKDVQTDMQLFWHRTKDILAGQA